MFEKIKSKVLSPVLSAVKWCFTIQGWIIIAMIPVFVLNVVIIGVDLYGGNDHDASLRIPTAIWVLCSITAFLLVLKVEGERDMANALHEVYKDRNEYLEEANQELRDLLDELVKTSKEVVAENEELKDKIASLKEDASKAVKVLPKSEG
jgi:Na+/melibiose symporter-like transporter